MKQFMVGAPTEQFLNTGLKQTKKQWVHTNMCFNINNKHFKWSNNWSMLASQIARYLHKMSLFEGVALIP